MSENSKWLRFVILFSPPPPPEAPAQYYAGAQPYKSGGTTAPHP